MRIPFKKRPRVRIGRVTALHPDFTNGAAYELTPESYAGPWELPSGTVLEVVSTPKRKGNSHA